MRNFAQRFRSSIETLVKPALGRPRFRSARGGACLETLLPELLLEADRWTLGWLSSTPECERAVWIAVARLCAWKSLCRERPEAAVLEARSHRTQLECDHASRARIIYGEQGDVEKAVGLLRMLDSYSEGTLAEGLERFFSWYRGEPIHFRSLYEGIRESSKPDKLPDWRALRSWLHEPGHPLLRSEVVTRDGVSGMAYRQTPYPSLVGRQGNQTWQIPARIKFEDQEGIKSSSALLSGRAGFITFPAVGALKWACPNGSSLGWFRTETPEQKQAS